MPPRACGASTRFAERQTLMCDHLYETTSPYETATQVLTFLLVCPICCVEEVVDTLE